MSSPSAKRQTEARSWKTKWTDIYLTCFFGKALFFAILQCRYFLLQNKLRHSDAQDSSDLHSQIEDLLNLMRRCGFLLREIGPPSFLSNVGGFVGYLIFVVASNAPNSFITDTYRNDGLILLYTNPELSEKQIRSAFDRLLEQLILLNTKKLSVIKRFGYSTLLSPEDSKRITRDIVEQQSQLRGLLSDKTAIWPKNRCEQWKQELTKFVLRSTMSMFVVICLVGSSSNTYRGVYSANLMALRGEKPNFLEILSIQEINFAIALYVERLVSPIVLLLVNLKDRRMTLRYLRYQFRQLDRQLVELSLYQAKQGTSNLIRPRWECSRKSLEIYLSLRLFLDELRSSAKLISLIASQYALLGLFLTLINSMLAFPWLKSMEGRFALQSLAILVLVINFTLLICSTLHSNCSKVVQLAWSLVAHTTIDNQDSEAVKPFEIERAIELKRFGRTVSRREHQSEIYMFDHLGASLINEQTALLWRRFVADIHKVRDNFRFTALGLFELNFRGVLRLNFWSISTLLIMSTYLS